MGLGQSINNALGGLRATQAGIELAARNVANANTEGYTRKSLELTNNVVGNKSFGVSIGAVTRQVDRFLQSKVHSEYADFNKLSVQTQFLEYVDTLFGKPGADGSLDTIVNGVSTALVDLANEPQLGAARQQVVENADYLASHIRDMSAQIQEMRQNTEQMIAEEVARANNAISNIARINHELTINQDDSGSADLLDQLDNHIDDLAAIFDIRVIEDAGGSVQVFTKNGILLADQNANRIEFDQRANIGAQQVYSSDESKRGVGTISLSTGAGGGNIDLLAQGSVGSGKIAGLLELRDKVLTNAQDQLDELAHGLAMTFNSVNVEAAEVTVLGNTGFNLDIAGLANGNVIDFEYKDNATGLTHKMSFVKVSDAAVLPLDNSATATANDTVVGIDFSGGIAGAQAQIAAAINLQNPNFNMSLTGASGLQILDDGAGNLVDVMGLSATKSASDVQGDGAAMNLFTDTGRAGEVNYTNSMAEGGQKLGFASRIRLNSAIMDDNSLLVKDSAATSIGDQTRPEELLKRFTETGFSFNANSGIGSQNSPFTGTLDSFTRQVVAMQTSRVSAHKAKADNQELVLSALNGRMEAGTKVNVDEEMANLLVLQTAYSANARVVSIAKELMDILMRM